MNNLKENWTGIYIWWWVFVCVCVCVCECSLDSPLHAKELKFYFTMYLTTIQFWFCYYRVFPSWFRCEHKNFSHFIKLFFVYFRTSSYYNSLLIHLLENFIPPWRQEYVRRGSLSLGCICPKPLIMVSLEEAPQEITVYKRQSHSSH